MSSRSGVPTKHIKPYGGRRRWKGNDDRRWFKDGIWRNAWLWKFVPGLVIGFASKIWLDQNQEAAEKQKKAVAKKKRTMPQAAIDPEAKLKMVLVVNSGLGMGTGKVAAQCSHATLGVYNKLIANHKSLLKMWEMRGQAKIVLKCQNKEELLLIEEKARQNQLPTYIVSDAGHTQVEAGSLTVCAIGPAPAEAIDAVTSKLKLM